MRIIDITVPLRPGMVVWPGDPAFERDLVSEIAKGDACNLSRLSMSIHLGTHIDAPRHFIDDGPAIDQIDPAVFVGPCRVVSIEGRERIDRDALEQFDLSGVERLLFKTTNSSRLHNVPTFSEKFVALTVDAARHLASIESLRLIGVDYYSIALFGDEHSGPAHRVILGRSIVALEGINLSEVAPGEYELIALPLKIEGADGSPVRAVLIEKS